MDGLCLLEICRGGLWMRCRLCGWEGRCEGKNKVKYRLSFYE